MAVLNLRNVPDELMRTLKSQAAAEGKPLYVHVIEILSGQPPWKTISPIEAKAKLKESKAATRRSRAQDDIPGESNYDIEASPPLSSREILEQETAPNQIIPAWAFDLPEGSEQQKFLVAYLRKRGAYPSSELGSIT